MFQTDIHHWLQSFDSPALRLFMQGVSVFGHEQFYTLLVLILLFGIERKRGFIVMQVMLWTSIVTGALKDCFALPRPVDVDRMVADLAGEQKHDSPFTARGASTFFGSLPDDVVAYCRHLPGVSYGFPSGHCSSSVATWGSLALLFRRAWLVWITVALFILMPLSRMYLGRHFLADVAGGLALGLIALIFVAVMRRQWTAAGVFPGEQTREHGASVPAGREPLRTWKGLAFLFVLPFFPMAFSESAGPNAAVLLGLNAGYMLTREMRALEGPRELWKRALTVSIAAGLAVALIMLLNLFNSTTQLHLTKPFLFAQQALVASLIVILTYWLARMLRLDSTSLKPA